MEEMTIDYQEGFRDGVRAVMMACIVAPLETYPEIISDMLTKETAELEEMRKDERYS